MGGWARLCAQASRLGGLREALLASTPTLDDKSAQEKKNPTPQDGTSQRRAGPRTTLWPWSQHRPSGPAQPTKTTAASLLPETSSKLEARNGSVRHTGFYLQGEKSEARNVTKTREMNK